MTAAQWFAVGALTAIVLTCLGGMVWMVATSYCREAYRRAGVSWTSHVDEAFEVANPSPTKGGPR